MHGMQGMDPSVKIQCSRGSPAKHLGGRGRWGASTTAPVREGSNDYWKKGKKG